MIKHPPIRAFLSLARLWRSQERLCMNGVKSLQSMCCLLLGYSFEPRPNNCAFGSAGSRMAIGLSISVCSHSENQFQNERARDWLVQEFGLRRLQRLYAIQAKPLLLLLTQEGTKRLFSQGVYKEANWTDCCFSTKTFVGFRVIYTGRFGRKSGG